MRYAEWCIAAPTLEADIAAAAMGLDDIGHSRVLYGSLRELGTEDGAVDDASNYANVPYLDRPWTEWAEFVAANAVLDSAFTLMIEALANGNVKFCAAGSRKCSRKSAITFSMAGAGCTRRRPAPPSSGRGGNRWSGSVR